MAVVAERGGAGVIGGERVFGEDFVGDEGDVLFRAEAGELFEFAGFQIAAGGVVGMDEENGFRVGGELGFEGLEVEPPAFGVAEGVLDDLDGFELGEEFEERVRRAGDEDGVAGVAEEFEEPSVGFGGGGGEKGMGGEVEGGAGFVDATGIGVVFEALRVLEGFEDGFRVVEADLGGVGCGEVETWLCCSQSLGELIGG